MTARRWDNFIYSAAVILPRLPAFILLPAIATALSLADMGKLASSWIFIELFQTMAGFGLKAALGRYFPMASEPSHRREILTIALSGILGGGLVLGLLTWVCFAWTAVRMHIHFFQAIDYNVFAALLAASIIGNLTSTFIIYFRAEQKAWAFLMASAIGAVVDFGLSLTLLLTGRLTIFNLLLLECLKQAVMLAFIAFKGRQDWGFAFSSKTFKTLFTFGLWFVPVGIGEWIVSSSDRFWLGQQGDMSLVGVYGFLYKFAMPLGILFTGSLMDLHARLYRMHGDEGLQFIHSNLSQYLFRAGWMMLAYSILLPALFLLMSRFHPIFPAVYLTGLAAFPIMVATLYVYYWGRFFGMVLEFNYHTRALMQAITLAAAASLILIPLAIRFCVTSNWNILFGTAYGALAVQLLSMSLLGRFSRYSGAWVEARKGVLFISACIFASFILAWIQ